MAQLLSDRIWQSVEKRLFGNGKAIHHIRFEDVVSVQGNDNKTSVRIKKGRFVWGKMEICLDINYKKDKNGYLKQALQHRIKFCRLVRLPLGKRYHYYVELVLEGIPPKKHTVGKGRVGIDPGTLSVAVASDTQCILEDLREGIPDYSDEIAVLQQKMDSSRRVNNPKNYNSDGTIKKGPKPWTNNKNYKKHAMHKRTLEGRQARAKKQHHEMLANRILSLGDEVYTETMNYEALKRRKKETTINEKTGKYDKKKRFGKSVENGAPSMLLSIIDRKLGYENKVLQKVDTKKFRASQYNHITDEYVKKRLSQRSCNVDGHRVQRDLYSAFLLQHSNEDMTACDRDACLKDFATFMKNHKECLDAIKSRMRDSNYKPLTSFGIK